MQFYREALKIAPDEPAVLTNMGLSLALARRLPEAERVLRQAAASPKADATMRGDLALVLALQGKDAEAERVGEQIVRPRRRAPMWRRSGAWSRGTGRRARSRSRWAWCPDDATRMSSLYPFGSNSAFR